MWQYRYSGEFYHHGIKGQRWGIRRFQKKDGSLTPAGKKRYDDADTPKKKSKHRTMVEEKYRKAGLSEKEAREQADKRIRAEKIVAGAAAVTVAACAAYVIRKQLKDRIDGVIKAGESLQRVEMKDTGGKLHDVFYTSKGKHDNKRYEGLLGMVRHKQAGEAYLMKLEANKDIKIASKDKAVKAFGDLYKNDSDFRNTVKDHVSQHFTGTNKVDTTNLSKKNLRKMYDNFNSGLVNMKGTGADDKFYNKLKSAGYGAIQDINDMKYSGYKAKNPLIVFGNSGNVSVKSVTKMAGDTVYKKGMKELAKAQGEAYVEKQMKTLGPMVAAGLTTTAAVTYANDYRDNVTIQKQYGR